MYLNITYRLIILFAWFMLILVLLLTPMPINPNPESLTFYDKITHAIIFGVQAFLTYYLLIGIKEQESKTDKLSRRKKKVIEKISIFNIFAFSFLTTLAYSYLLEHLQKYVMGRSCNSLDFYASVIGVVLVLLFIYGDNYTKK